MEPKARPRLLNPAVPARHPVVPNSACIAGPLYPGRLRRLSLRGPPTASPSQASQTRVVPHIPNPLPHPAFHRSRGLEGWKELEQLLCPNPRGVRREAQRQPQRVTGDGRNSTQQHCCLMTPSRTAHRIHVGRKAQHTASTSPPSFSHRYGMAAALQAATYYVSCAIITAIAVSGKWRCADPGETPIIITTNRHRKSQATSSPPMTRRGAMGLGRRRRQLSYQIAFSTEKPKFQLASSRRQQPPPPTASGVQRATSVQRRRWSDGTSDGKPTWDRPPRRRCHRCRWEWSEDSAQAGGRSPLR